MRILFFSRYYKPHVGGVETHVEKLSHILAKKNYQITIITEQYDSKLALTAENNINIYRVPFKYLTSKKDLWLFLLRNLNQAVKTSDIIHIHDIYWWYFPFRILYPNKPTYITFHGYEGYKPPTIKAIIHRKIVELLVKKSICIGEFMKNWYQARPDMVLYGAGANQKKKLPLNHNAIFVGRLSQDTGILTYLKGMKLLNSPIKLVVFGDGPQYKQAQQFSGKNKLNVSFKGFVANASAKMYKFRYAFVSRYLAIIEAMQTRRLVFTHYNNKIKKDYLTCHPQAKNMIIFNSAKQLKKQLEFIIANPEVEKRMINDAYLWAKTQTWEKLAEKYLELWGLK